MATFPHKDSHPSVRALREGAAALLALLFTTPAFSAQPVTLLTSGFDSITLSGTTASSIEWTIAPGVTMLNSGNLTSLSGYNFSVRGNQSTTNNLSVNSNLNTTLQPSAIINQMCRTHIR